MKGLKTSSKERKGPSTSIARKKSETPSLYERTGGIQKPILTPKVRKTVERMTGEVHEGSHLQDHLLRKKFRQGGR